MRVGLRATVGAVRALSALHRPQSAGARLGIRDTANRCRTAKQLFEFALRKVSWRNGSRVVGAASDDSENDAESEIAFHEGTSVGSLTGQ